MKTPGLHSLQVFATDLDPDAIDKARLGLYPQNVAADVSPERLRRFFIQEEQGYRISKPIRDCVIFAPQNVIMEPPFTRLDILVCRNLLIYLEVALQKKLLPLFHYALKPGGILFLGSSETIGQYSDLFAPLDAKARLYRRLVPAERTTPVEFPSAFFPSCVPPSDTADTPGPDKPPAANLQALADHLLLQQFAPAAVLTTDRGDILYISGRTGKYLEPAAGKANWNIFAMAREGLRLELTSAFQRVLKRAGPITLHGLRVADGSESRTVDVTVQVVQENNALRGLVIIVFTDVASPPEKVARTRKRPSGLARTQLEQMDAQLQLAREELQFTREEMQTSQEELKSTNEELQSTNEELQSTNEELTTSKEEMQSMNEELQTVNMEMQSKLDELSRSNNDLMNLLNSTDIATLFLDENLYVRRFTPQTASIIKLIPGDVGRPVTDIVTELDYPDMARDARSVLESLVFVEKPVGTRDGRWFLVRVKPYRTLDNRIDGVVITFSDISVAKRLEVSLRENERRMLALFQDMPVAFALLESVFDASSTLVDGRFLFANTAFERLGGEGGVAYAGRTLRDVWPQSAPACLRAFGPTVATGAAQSLALDLGRGSPPYRCSVFRPEKDSGRFCLLLDEGR